MCQGSGSVVCVAQDQCHTAGLCDPATGCSNPEKANGALCDDGTKARLREIAVANPWNGG